MEKSKALIIDPSDQKFERLNAASQELTEKLGDGGAMVAHLTERIESLLNIIDDDLPSVIHDRLLDAAEETINAYGNVEWEEIDAEDEAGDEDIGVKCHDTSGFLSDFLLRSILSAALDEATEEGAADVMGNDNEVAKLFCFKPAAWEALRRDAARCNRTPSQQLAAILGAYYKLVEDNDEGSIPAVTVGLMPSLR